MTRHSWMAGLALAIGLAVGEAEAQPIARSFQALCADLKSGDIVVVADEAGETWGQVAEVSPSSLTVLAGERVGDGATFPKTSARAFADVAVLAIWRADARGRKGVQLFSQPARGFGDLQRVVKAGDTVTVMGTDGHETRGVVETVSPAGLSLRRSVSAFAPAAPGSKPQQPMVFRADDVARVTRGGDSRWNGVAIGAGVGLALGMVSVIDTATANGDTIYAVAALPFLAGAGAGIGFLVDWSIGRKETVWTAGGSRAHAEISPIVGRGTKGVALSLRF
jgi:hypothetical protein